MKCRDAHEMLNSYFDNRTDPMKDKLLVEHIESCPRCRAELEFLIKYKNILKSVKPVTPPGNFLSELHRKIELEQSAHPVKKFIEAAGLLLNSFRFPIEAAGVLAVAAVVFFLYKPFFSEKIQTTHREYGIESPNDGALMKKDLSKSRRETEKSISSKKSAAKNRGIVSDEKISQNKILKSDSEGADLSLKPATESDSAKMNEMEKVPSAEDKKRAVKEETKLYSTDSNYAKEIISSKKDSAVASDSDIEKIFREYKVSVIKKDLSNSSRLYYRVKVYYTDHSSMINRLKKDYQVKEKIIKKRKPYYETELFLQKNKK